MTARAEIERRTAGSDLELDHVSCCDDPNLGICGADLSAHAFVHTDPTCTVCADLDDTDFCPKYDKCRVPT